MKTQLLMWVSLTIIAAAAGRAEAALVLDTGTPTTPSTAMPSLLDGTDFVAAEFNLNSASTINSISAYVTGGLLGASGDTFTVALYSGADFGSRFASPVFTAQATYAADGWTSVSGGGLVESAGTYWVALEVGAADSTSGLELPQTASGGGTAPAMAFAYNSGGGYTPVGAAPFGVQLDATAVPLPPSLWLLGGGLVGLVLARKKGSNERGRTSASV
jgi:hypothetical protein